MTPPSLIKLSPCWVQVPDQCRHSPDLSCSCSQPLSPHLDSMLTTYHYKKLTPYLMITKFIEQFHMPSTVLRAFLIVTYLVLLIVHYDHYRQGDQDIDRLSTLTEVMQLFGGKASNHHRNLFLNFLVFAFFCPLLAYKHHRKRTFAGCSLLHASTEKGACLAHSRCSISSHVIDE